MTSKRKKLDKINELLDKAESSIVNPQKSRKTYRYLGEAYTLLCDIVDWRDDTARQLDDLSDYLEEYYESNRDKENEQCFDFLAEKVSEISSTIAEMNDNDDSDNSDSDDSSDAVTFSNSDEDTIDSEDFSVDLPMIYEAPENPYGDKCSLQHLRVKDNKVPTQNQESHYGTIHAALVRTSKQGVEKYRWSVGSIHHYQRVTMNHQSNNQGNTLVVDLSFSIKATFNGNEQPFTICFPLKIPKSNRQDTSNKSDCFNFSDVSTDNQISLQNLQTLKTLYTHGRQVRGINVNTTHGTKPKYDNSSSDKQFIYHTEQTLSVYLCQAEVAEMILDRLIAEIRVQQTNLPLGALLKIYHVALHLHSDKTPCGPCEFTLLGLQNTWRNNGLQIKGFTEYFEDALSSRQYNINKNKPGIYFNFTFPGKSKICLPEKKGIRMFTLFSAEKCDGTHKQAPVANQPVDINDREESVIETRNRSSSRYLTVVNFGEQLPEQIWKNEEPDTSQRTTFLSGSNKTPESGKTVSKIGQIREEEDKLSDVSGFFQNIN